MSAGSFRGRDLRLAVFDRADLRKADFSGAMLNGARFEGAKLKSARFGCTIFQMLNCTWLQGASFYHAELQGASLEGAQLQGATFLYAELQGASLKFARLVGASINGANLQGALLNEAWLQGASLGASNLQGASLDGALLQGALLNFASLQGASLFRTQLQGASLHEAQMQAAWVIDVRAWRAHRTPSNLEHVYLDNIDLEEPNTFAVFRGDTDEGADLVHDFRRMAGTLSVNSVPEGDGRQELMKRLTAVDPSEREPKDTLDSSFWSRQPQGEDRQRVAFLAHLACTSSDAALYVSLGRNLNATGAQILANELRKGQSDPNACPGVKVGFTNQDWAAVILVVA